MVGREGEMVGRENGEGISIVYVYNYYFCEFAKIMRQKYLFLKRKR